MSSKLSIVIPVFNEEATVGELLKRVAEQDLGPGILKELVIVESNSSDKSREVVQNFASHKYPFEVKVVLQEKARGKGNAMREGFNHATGDVILIQDADLEYDTGDYPLLLEPLLAKRTSFVLGSRHLSAGGWKIRKFDESPFRSWVLNLGGVFFHFLFNVLYGTRLTDPTTMYKVFRRSCLSGLEFSSNRFDFDFELLAKLIRSGHSPLEVPVSYRSRGFEEGKKVTMVGDPLSWIVAIVKFRFMKLSKEALKHGKSKVNVLS